MAVGQEEIAPLKLTNIHEGPVILRMKQSPNVQGPFSIVNALRPLSGYGNGQEETMTVYIRFKPEDQLVYCERIEFETEFGTASVVLVGQGVSPTLELTPSVRVFVMMMIILLYMLYLRLNVVFFSFFFLFLSSCVCVVATFDVYVLMFYSPVIMSLFCCFFLFHCSTVPLFHCSTVPLFHCSTVLLFSCSPVLLFSCSPILLFSYSPVLLFF